MPDVLMPRLQYLTTGAHNAFAHAHALAEERGHAEITPLHLAVTLVRHKGVPAGALHNLGVPLEQLEQDLKTRLPHAETPLTSPRARSWSAWDKQVIQMARHEADKLGTGFYGAEHLLLALIGDVSSVPAQVLLRYGIGYEDVKREVLRMYEISNRDAT